MNPFITRVQGTQRLRVLTFSTLALFAMVAESSAQTEVKGEAILKHPIGQLALKTVELMTAGKIDEVFALRNKSEQADWKKSSASDRKELGALMKQRAPSPAALTEAIRKTGVLKIQENQAELNASNAAGDIIAYYELEGGQWRAATGPMILGGGPTPAGPETRVQGGDILKHPIGDLALKYADLLQAGKVDEAMLQLASTEAQAKWKALPASERKESAAFRRKTIPSRTELAAGIQSGGILIIEGDSRATLNVIRMEQKTTAPGTVSSTSTTTAIGFAMENGQWKIAQ